ERRRLADHQIGARQLVGRLPSQERAVLADPGFRHAEPVSHDDLLEVLVVAELGDLVVAVAVGENTDLHPALLTRRNRRLGGRSLSSEPHHCHFGRGLYKSGPMGVQRDRLAETVRYLGNESLDGLVAVNYGHNSFLESHAVFVLSGVRPIGESAVVVDRAGASTLIVTPAWDAERATKLS